MHTKNVIPKKIIKLRKALADDLVLFEAQKTGTHCLATGTTLGEFYIVFTVFLQYFPIFF